MLIPKFCFLRQSLEPGNCGEYKKDLGLYSRSPIRVLKSFEGFELGRSC